MTTTTEPRHWRAIYDDLDREVSNLDFPLLHGEVMQPRITELMGELRGCLVASEGHGDVPPGYEVAGIGKWGTRSLVRKGTKL
jgi:hypothetical protein